MEVILLTQCLFYTIHFTQDTIDTMVSGISLYFTGVLLLATLCVVLQKGWLQSEGFTSELYPSSQLCKVPLTTENPLRTGPADETLKDLRKPYHLLGDFIESGDERISNSTSEFIYQTDNQRFIEKTGSYGQVTNNYKRKTPDNGTTWLNELALSFYKL